MLASLLAGRAESELDPPVELGSPDTRSAVRARAALRQLGGYVLAVFALAALPAWRMVQLAQNSDLGVITALVFAGVAWHLWRYVPPWREANRGRIVAAWACVALVVWQLAWIGPEDYWFARTALVIHGVVLAALWGGIVRGWRAVGAITLWAGWLHVAEPLGQAMAVEWISERTAALAAWFLWQGGLNISMDGTQIFTRDGIVQVGWQCTGLPLALHLLTLLAIAALLLRLRAWTVFTTALATIGVAFAIGIVRVAWLTTIVADTATFDYWHSPEGGAWFTAIGIVALAWLLSRTSGHRPTAAATETPMWTTLPFGLRHVSWPIASALVAALLFDANQTKPLSGPLAEMTAPSLVGAQLVGDRCDERILTSQPYNRFAGRRDVTYRFTDLNAQLHVTVARLPLMLDGDPRALLDAPQPSPGGKWGTISADDGEVWAASDGRHQVWLATWSAEGRRILSRENWKHEYLSGFGSLARWWAWFRHERALCDKGAWFIALNWHTAQENTGRSEAEMAAAYSAWWKQARALTTSARSANY